jgi:hypothetical protein
MKSMIKKGLLAIFLLPLQACSVLHYYPGEEGVGTCRGCTYGECIKRNGKPDKEIKSTDGTMLLAYYTGRSIYSGYGLFKVPIHKERHVFALKHDKVVDEYYVIQVTEGPTWWCGNVSGHGDFCGVSYEKSCKQYNSNNTLSCVLREE